MEVMERLGQRFSEKVVFAAANECWLWQGCRLSHGYGQTWDGKRVVGAHRYAYERLVGPIPEGLTIDHLCRVRHCVNPAHMEPVTAGENARRGENPNRAKTHCKYGHPFDAENTYVRASGGRECRACRHLALRRFYERRRVAA
jgi:hypothetical protein